jgi:hypothetical protein
LATATSRTINALKTKPPLNKRRITLNWLLHGSKYLHRLLSNKNVRIPRNKIHLETPRTPTPPPPNKNKNIIKIFMWQAEGLAYTDPEARNLISMSGN